MVRGGFALLPMRASFLLVLLALAVSAFAEPVSLAPLVDRPDLWATKAEDFLNLPEAKGFVWNSQARDSARAAAHQGSMLTLFGLPVLEAIARFDGGKLVQFQATIYDRGDAGSITKEQYDQVVQATAVALNQHTKVKPIARGKDASNAVHADGVIWQTPTARYLLEYSETREVKVRNIPYRAEFVRLQISPPERTVSLLASAANATRARFTGPMHVKRDLASGDVVIPDVPMVDQGQKGYCVVAATERVMRYYGVSVDANELAEVANSSASRGTSMNEMLEALKRLSARLKVRIRPIEQMDVRQILELMKNYNRVARHEQVAPIPEQGQMLDLTGIMLSMKREVLEEARTKNKADLSRFEREVASNVENGTPLLWTVMLGIVPEKGIAPGDGGGHMRLIIGYNTPKDEILYTDTWGAGHELKRMPAADAWTISTGLTVIEPL